MAVKSSFANMVLCLSTVTLVCGALLAYVYTVTEEPVRQAAEARTQKAIADVTPVFDSLEDAVTADGMPYIVAKNSAGEAVAYVLDASSVGFGGKISLKVGFLPDGTIFKTSVLSHSETPGLGAKCTDPAFAGQFERFDTSSKVLSVRKDGGDVDAITASTITSRAYCKALQNATDAYRAIAATFVVEEPLDSLAAELSDESIEIEEGKDNE
ncbi:MAG: RnfABCDGE type electron transport complex subunit G [Bacteroidales bacterium]|nr:RnfABCDGE type electron transport complex subunit G [Candidatus Hennigimonas equi]